MKTDEHILHTVYRIGEVLLETVKLSPDEAFACFLELENELISSSEEEASHIAIKRVIAEVRMAEFNIVKDARNHFNAAWEDLERLGYSTVEREASMLFFRVQGLFAHGSSYDEVSPVLERLNRIIDSGMDGQTEVADGLRSAIKRMLARSSSS